MTQVDIVVAVRNEEETIPQFVQDVFRLDLPDSVRLGLIFVEDSSTDGTRAVLRREAARNPAVSYYALENGFGQGPAVVFGVSRSTADGVIMMDVDGTHPISAIPQLIGEFLSGRNIVQCMRRTLPGRPTYRRIGAGAFHWLARLLTGANTEQQNIFYRLIGASVARQLLRQPRYWRFLRLPLPGDDRQVTVIELDTKERAIGKSKYNFWRLTVLAMDAVLSLTSAVRFTVLVLACSVVTVWLGFFVSWFVAAAIVLALLGIVMRYALQGSDLLRRMRVLEFANAAPALAPDTAEYGAPQ